MQSEIFKLVEQAEQVERQRREKIDAFFRLVRDPDLAAQVALIRNGHSAPPLERPKSQKKRKQPRRAAGFRNGNGIQSAVAGLALPERFTVQTVLDQLRAGNFEFASKDPRGAVRDAVFALSKEGSTNQRFKIVERPKGGQPNIYARIQQ
jgi:hypothetical protein